MGMFPIVRRSTVRSTAYGPDGYQTSNSTNTVETRVFGILIHRHDELEVNTSQDKKDDAEHKE